MEITARKREIFKNLVKYFIKTGEPVGSNFLVAKIGLDVSSATVRNELAELEEAGLLHQPHTSAGRVPSEAGWEFFVNNLMEEAELDAKLSERLKNIFKKYKGREAWKSLAKEIAEISNETVIVAFGKDDIYYTGFSNFFAKPELTGVSVNFGNMIDKMNDVIRSTYDKINNRKVHVMIGKNNPFGNDCASVLAKVDDHLVVVLGLMRMDYDETVGLLNFIQELLSNS